MKEETKQAIKDSIAHWKRMKENRRCGETPGPHGCALCQLFLHSDCVGCPIAERTKYTFCEGSPYFAASRAFCIGSDSKWQAAAEAEIQFLTSLLPNETQS